MSEFKPITSSNLKAAAYDAAKQELTVEFKSGAKYRYPEVSENLYRRFEANFDGKDGRSAGKFFHAEIRDLPAEKLEE